MSNNSIYKKSCTIKPDIRDIVWVYERTKDLKESVIAAKDIRKLKCF